MAKRKKATGAIDKPKLDGLGQEIDPAGSYYIQDKRQVVGWTRGQDLEGAYNVWRGPVIVAYGTTRKAADAAARLLGGAS